MIIGASGRLGSAIERVAPDFPYFHIVQRVTREHPELINLDNVDVVLDVSRPESLKNNLDKIVAARKPLVIGSTGHSDASLLVLREASKEIPIFHSSNFSPGIDHVKKMLSILPYPIKASIQEVHHTGKKDAPSGTAKDLAKITETPVDEILSERKEGVIGEHSIHIFLDDEVIKISHTASSRTLYARGAIKACQFLSNKDKGYYTSFHDEDPQHHIRQK